MGRFLVILGGGGHTAEMVELTRRLGAHDYEYACAKNDDLSVAKIVHPGRVHRVTSPLGMHNRNFLRVLAKSLPAVVNAFRVMFRTKAKVIITSGPAMSVPICLIGRLFGRKLVFVETISRVHTRSRTGGVLYPLSALSFIQWKSLAPRYPKALFCGRLL